MGHRNPDIGRRRNTRSHPWNHLNRHTALGQISGFFTTTAKQKRIAPLQPHHTTATPSQLLQQRIGAGLRHGVVAAPFTDRMNLTALRHQLQELHRHQRVVHQGITTLQQTMGPQRQQLRVSRTRSHQINDAGRVSGHGKSNNSSKRN